MAGEVPVLYIEIRESLWTRFLKNSSCVCPRLNTRSTEANAAEAVEAGCGVARVAEGDHAARRFAKAVWRELADRRRLCAELSTKRIAI